MDKKRDSIFSNLDIDLPEQAFKNAIKKGLKNPEDYMYMYSDDRFDYFKNAVTRKYIYFSNEYRK